MRLEGTLDKLTGNGELDEHDLEMEWQHKLDASPNWQEKMNSMTNHQRKNFLRHKRDAFLEGIRKAFAHAEANLHAPETDAAAADDGDKDLLPSTRVEEGSGSSLQESDGFQRELSREIPRAPETALKHVLSQKEYEKLALAMFQRNCKHQADSDDRESEPCEKLSREEYEARTLARIKEERKQQDESLKMQLLYKESQRRKKEKRNRKLKAFDARREKFNAKQ